jgi:predicted site-specific integrase-resolvase
MAYTLAAAATATGLNKRTILRAIKSGQIAATKDQQGEWHIEAADLQRVFPPSAQSSDGAAANERPATADVEALGAQIEALLRQAGERLRQQIDEARRVREDSDEQSQRLVFADQQRER